MKHISTFIFCIGILGFFQLTETNAQNLIKNGGFEEYNSLPESDGEFHVLKHWVNPAKGKGEDYEVGTPDFFHGEAKGKAKAPATGMGFCFPNTGEGMVGLVLLNSQDSELTDFREYMSTELSDAIVKGKKYKLSFYFTTGIKDTYGRMGVKDIGFYISETLPLQKGNKPMGIGDGLVEINSEDYFFSPYWKYIEIEFEAEISGNYITIGNFKNDKTTDAKQVLSDNGTAYFSYIFIDDVKLETIDKPVEIVCDLRIEKTIINNTCGNNNQGAIDLKIKNGTPPYTFEWSDIKASTNQRNNLHSGEYHVTISDKKGCKKATTVNIKSEAPLNIKTNKTEISCYGVGDGRIDLLVKGGEPPYTFKWSDKKKTRKRENMEAGTYSVTVSDQNSCDEIIKVDFLNPEKIQTDITEIDEKDYVSIRLNTKGGHPPYTYKWNDGEIGDYREKVSEGEYKISVTDNNKCIKVEKISIKLDKPIPPPTTGFADSLLIGETIRLSIFFEADSSNIENEHHIELEKLYTFLKNYPSIKIEISGHTNGLPEKEYCFWLSNSRIKSVSRFLEDKGIERDRLTLRAKGKSEPLASDRTAKGRRKNQRVEVRKISD